MDILLIFSIMAFAGFAITQFLKKLISFLIIIAGLFLIVILILIFNNILSLNLEGTHTATKESGNFLMRSSTALFDYALTQLPASIGFILGAYISLKWR